MPRAPKFACSKRPAKLRTFESGRLSGTLAGGTMPTTDVTTAGQSAQRHLAQLRLAVLVPCYNEEAAIAGVVKAFRAELPEAVVYVYDNNSTDRSVEAARSAGAVVRRETHQG